MQRSHEITNPNIQAHIWIKVFNLL
jgi:hypothetical protein